MSKFQDRNPKFETVLNSKRPVSKALSFPFGAFEFASDFALGASDFSESGTEENPKWHS
jgi:hypothetical protein